MKNDLLISAENVSHSFSDKANILQNISLEIPKDQIITLIGPNGAGKSTLVKILLKLTTPTQGKVIHHQKLEIGFMPQKLHLDPTLPLTVERFLKLGAPQASHDELLNQLADLELDETLLNQAVQSLSGGQMQRAMLARALLRNPNLLVLDEPVQGIDLQSQSMIYQQIYREQRKRKCGVLMISHDLHLVMKNTDQVICLNQHICCAGTAQAIEQNPIYLKDFGGDLSQHAIYQHQHDHCEHHETSDN